MGEVITEHRFNLIAYRKRREARQQASRADALMSRHVKRLKGRHSWATYVAIRCPYLVVLERHWRRTLSNRRRDVQRREAKLWRGW